MSAGTDQRRKITIHTISEAKIRTVSRPDQCNAKRIIKNRLSAVIKSLITGWYFTGNYRESCDYYSSYCSHILQEIAELRKQINPLKEQIAGFQNLPPVRDSKELSLSDYVFYNWVIN